MKKSFSFLSLLILILLSVATPSKIYATDISVGATTWYTWYNASQDIITKLLEETPDIDPTFMYGPVLSVKFNNDFNLTSTYLYGKFDIKTNSHKIETTRKDLDLALNYRINDYLKAFIGLKYIGYSIIIDSLAVSEHKNNGPGLGLSATLPLTENLFLLANMAGIYLWGNNGLMFDGALFFFGTKSYGMNSNFSVAYYITPASTIISLGGRFQYIKTVYDRYYGFPAGMLADYSNKFYGITLTATYNFTI